MTPLRARRERIEQLAEALEGDRPLEDAPEQVRSLVALATRVSEDVPAPTMSADARDRVRDRVLAEIHLAEAEADAPTPTRAARSPRAAIAAGLASAMVAAGGVTVAAQEALPGDALYGLKKATESVREAMIADPLEISRLELTLARERLDEVIAATERGDARPSAMVGTLREMDTRSIAGVDGLLRVAEIQGEPELLIEAAQFTDRQYSDLTAAYRDLPVTVRPHAEDSLAVLRALRLERIDPALEACAECADLLPASVTTSAIGDALISPLPPGATVADRPSPDQGPATSTSERAPTPAPATPSPELTDDDLLDGVRPDRSTSDRLVPRLPGPLEGVGDAVDDTLGGVVDGAGRVLDETGDVLEGTGDAVEDTTDTLQDTVEGVTGGLTGGLSDGLSDGLNRNVDGLLGND